MESIKEDTYAADGKALVEVDRAVEAGEGLALFQPEAISLRVAQRARSDRQASHRADWRWTWRRCWRQFYLKESVISSLTVCK